MSTDAKPQTMEACSTPSPQKATVFNMAEYKRQMASKQQTTTPTKPKAKATAAATPVKKDDSTAVVTLENPGKPIMKVEARYEFAGDLDKSEMSFEKGDYISVYGKSKLDGWWVGRAQGEKQTLYFPFNYVKFVKKFN